MANYATNLFFASTENEEDLDKIGQFLDENFDSVYERDNDSIEGEFFSGWTYPQELMDDLIAMLEDKDNIYIRVLTFEYSSEYVSFRVFSSGKWKTKIETTQANYL